MRSIWLDKVPRYSVKVPQYNCDTFQRMKTDCTVCLKSLYIIFCTMLIGTATSKKPRNIGLKRALWGLMWFLWCFRGKQNVFCPLICTRKYLGEDEADGVKKTKLAKMEELLREMWADNPVESDWSYCRGSKSYIKPSSSAWPCEWRGKCSLPP